MAVEFQPSFKGCVVIPLTDDDADINRIRYHGDWLKRLDRIIKKKRRYQLTFYLNGVNGEKAREQVKILDKEDFMELAALIHHFGEELRCEIGKDRIDLSKSYVTIRA